MSDEPSLGELSRRIDGLTSMLAQLVQRTEYAADQRLAERRFAELEHDVADLRRAIQDELKSFKASNAEELKALKTSIDNAAEKRGTNMRQAVYAGVLPAVLVLLGIVVQIWIALRGGT